MGSLADAVAALTVEKSRCKLGRLHDELPPAEQAMLAGWLADSTVQTAWITRVLRTAGHSIGENTVRQHRLHDCSCPR